MPEKISRLAFGSCYHHIRHTHNVVYNTILKQNPDMWLWLGDLAYAFYRRYLDQLSWRDPIFNYGLSFVPSDETYVSRIL